MEIEWAVVLAPGLRRVRSARAQASTATDGSTTWSPASSSSACFRATGRSAGMSCGPRTATDPEEGRLDPVRGLPRPCDHDFCSSVCCMYAIKEAVIAKEHQARSSSRRSSTWTSGRTGRASTGTYERGRRNTASVSSAPDRGQGGGGREKPGTSRSRYVTRDDRRPRRVRHGRALGGPAPEADARELAQAGHASWTSTALRAPTPSAR